MAVLAMTALTSGVASRSAGAALAGRPGGRPVGVYLVGTNALALAATTGLEVRPESAVRALPSESLGGDSAKSGELPALVLDDVLGYRVRHVEEASLGAPVNPAAYLDLTAVRSLRNDLQLIP